MYVANRPSSIHRWPFNWCEWGSPSNWFPDSPPPGRARVEGQVSRKPLAIHLVWMEATIRNQKKDNTKLFFYFAGRRTTKVVNLCHSLLIRVAQAFRFVSRFLLAQLHQSNETSMPHDSQLPADSEAQPNMSRGSESPVPKVNLAWLQLRMGWPTVGKIRLDREKKDAIASIISHYEKVRVPDRARAEFDQVLQRLEEEHAMRLRELLKEQRRAAKLQNNPIQIIQETNASKIRQRVELTEETPPLIAEWKRLIERLF